LIVSAYPNDYTPTQNSLIGALYRKGISVKDLANNKSVDLRENFSCWLSHEIKTENTNFRKLLCFEPYTKGLPSEVVGDIFQSLMPFVFSNPPIKNIAMPLIATGDQNHSIENIISPLINAASNWLLLGLPVERIKIVEYSEAKAYQILEYFSALKRKFEYKKIAKNDDYKYDIFISYSHRDKKEILFVEQELKRLKPDIKLFLDLRDLNTGMAWQEELYEALDNCQRVIAFLSPPYLTSKVCKEEFNIA